MRCHCCGRFFSGANGYHWKMVYSGHPPTPSHELYQCPKCTEAHGSFTPDPGIRPECSVGFFRPKRLEQTNT